MAKQCAPHRQDMSEQTSSLNLLNLKVWLLVQLALLRNVHTYFSQFVGDVNAQIVNLRTPIESKLKEFIKIARWDKQNYYSLKASSDKSHAKLKEFMRKFGEFKTEISKKDDSVFSETICFLKNVDFKHEF